MPEGFFKASKLLTTAPPSLAIPQCGKCGLWQNCQSPKMAVAGKGRRQILIVGEAPGETEDREGRPFVGKAGRRLQNELSGLGLDMFRDCWITNSIICRPERNATPTDKQLGYCRPNITKTINKLKPVVIVTLGEPALKTVLDGLWRDQIGQVGRWVGWRIPNRSPNAWVCPTWHPSYLERSNDAALDFWFRRHLQRAVRLTTRPWVEPVPDYQSQIDVELDPDRAAHRIRQKLLLGDFPAAFDYETTCLKPEADCAEIVCCSICWEGKQTISYPWSGKAIAATVEFLKSKCPKIASNMKFEDRWSRRHLGTRVRNWHWDTMQAAHILDNRSGITSIKFQAFVRLGVPVYDSQIKPFLESPGSMTRNRVREIDPQQLMLYCGMDSLLEYKVYELQRKEMKYDQR